MANTIFALDIHDDLVVGVMVDCVAKTNIVTACGIAEVGSRSIETAVSEVLEQVGYRQGVCRVNLGAGHFFFRNLHFPFNDRKKIGKIIPGELAENSALQADALMFDFLLAHNKGQGASVIAAIAERSFLTEQMEVLQRLSLDPEIIGISGTHGAIRLGELHGVPESYIFLDIGFHRAVLVLILAGKISLVRSLVFDAGFQADFRLNRTHLDVSPLRPENLAIVYSSFAKSVRQTISLARVGLQNDDLPLYLAGAVGFYPGLAEILHSEIGIEVKPSSLQSRPLLKLGDGVASRWHAAMDRALALALSSGKGEQDFNFRKDGLRKKGSMKDYCRYGKTAALPLILLVFLIASYCWNDHATLRKQHISLEKEIRKVFSETLPDVTRIVNPVQQLQVRIDEAKQAYMAGGADSAGSGMLALLAEISSRIPASMQVKIVKMVADRNDARLKGITDNFNIVDGVRKELEKSPVFAKVEISSANLSTKGGAVDFELKLDLRR